MRQSLISIIIITILLLVTISCASESSAVVIPDSDVNPDDNLIMGCLAPIINMFNWVMRCGCIVFLAWLSFVIWLIVTGDGGGGGSDPMSGVFSSPPSWWPIPYGSDNYNCNCKC